MAPNRHMINANLLYIPLPKVMPDNVPVTENGENNTVTSLNETESKVVKGVKVLLCKFCEYTSKKSDNMNHHIVIHVLGKAYSTSGWERKQS